MSQNIRLKKIGVVRTNANLEELRHRDAISEIVIQKRFSNGLEGIGAFSHIFVLFWMHQTLESERNILMVHPQHNLEIPLQGVFATRSKFRPNSIGLTIVRLLRKSGNILKVQGLDAINGTPILDLKPYDYLDRHDEIRVPAWWNRLEHERLVEKNKTANKY